MKDFNMINVSVVVPVYNVSKYLDECLRSLIEQTLKGIDIILVDDGSDDGSEIICDNYKNNYENIRVIHKKNGGLGSARNVGLEAAIGEYVYFIDSDDSINKNALKILYTTAKENKLDVILFSATCFSDGFGIQYNANEYNRTTFLNEVFTGKDLFLNLIRAKEYYANIPLRFYKTQFLKERNYSFPEHIIHEDEVYGFWTLIQASKAMCIPNRFYNRRFRAGSIMNSNQAFRSCIGYVYTWEEMIKSLDWIENWSTEEKIKVLHFANSRLSIAINIYSHLFNTSEIKAFKKYIPEIKKTANMCNIFKSSSRRIKLFIMSPCIYRVLIRTYYSNPQKMISSSSWMEKKLLDHSLKKLKKGHVAGKSYAILIGTPTHGNMGDQAIVYSEKEFLNKLTCINGIIEICSSNYLKYADKIQEYISKKDIIIFDGGGSMGTLWVGNEYRLRDIVQRFPNNYIYIFPQSISYGNEEWERNVLTDSEKIYSEHPRLTIICRDKFSYSFSTEHFRHNRLMYVPDIVLYLYPQKMPVSRKDRILLCFRNDMERVLEKNTKDELIKKLYTLNFEIRTVSTLTGGYITPFNRKEELTKKLNEFAEAKLVVTDRLHAMLFCALTGTPCIAFDTKSGKVGGSYVWLTRLPYIWFCDHSTQIQELDLKLLLSKADTFKNLHEVKRHYKEIKEQITKDIAELQEKK